MTTNTRKKGFTLVEILIVVVILGILAAIVIPQFSEASSEARKSSVQSNLQMVRSQIELFKIQHNDNIPGFGTASFYDCLTEKTDIYGAVDAAGDYGPYMQTFPSNALNTLGSNIDESEVVILATGTRAVSATDGWAWDTNSEDFYACDGIDVDKDSDNTNDSLLW
jgi:general secretion pathway protein G